MLLHSDKNLKHKYATVDCEYFIYHSEFLYNRGGCMRLCLLRLQTLHVFAERYKPVVGLITKRRRTKEEL